MEFDFVTGSEMNSRDETDLVSRLQNKTKKSEDNFFGKIKN
jgi:hypothetical protein